MNLFEKTLTRIKDPIFDFPVISTNTKYIKLIKKHLKKEKIKQYKIILEPLKRNTAPAILASSLIKEIPKNQPLLFLAADHLIENPSILKKSIKENLKNLTDKDIFIFGIKPKSPSSEYGYFLSKKIKNKLNKVTRFIEKPNKLRAQQIIKKNGYWNSGMFFLRKDSIIYNYKKYQPAIFKNCLNAVAQAKIKKNTYYLKKTFFQRLPSKSFDYSILEKAKKINAIKLNIDWSDLGSWKEICKMFNRNKKKYFKAKNVHYRPWGKYVNLFVGKGFLVKELYVKAKGVLSLQKHYHRAEHWMVTQGVPKITLNKKSFFKNPNETIYIPQGAIHRIQNIYKKPVKIIEVQVGSILKETDIVRYEDVYGRVK